MESSVLKQADELKALKDKKKALEAEIKELNQVIDQVQTQLLQSMIDEEVGKFDRKGFTFYSTTRVHASVKAGCKPHVIDWLKGSEFADMVREDVNARTLEAWAREHVEQNDQLPDGVSDYINMFEKQTISIRKAQ